MRSFITLAILLLLSVASSLRAQVTVIVNFDNPVCRADSNPGTYQGIIFTTGSPWDCEASGYPGASGLSLSWTSNRETNGIESGTFNFVSPSVLNSYRMASSMTNVSLTISTDAGESSTIAPTQTFATYQTGFQKPATVVTVACTCGWTLEMDDITYTVPPPLPPPPVVVPVSGLGTVTFPIQGPSPDMMCGPNDIGCTISFKFADTSIPQQVCRAQRGLLTIEKNVTGQPTISTVIAIIGP